MNWRDLSYLLEMGETQVKAYHALGKLGIFESLREYDPVLVGTIPIGINIEGSDLDIVCHVDDLEAFSIIVANTFGHLRDYSVNIVDGISGKACVINFYYLDYEIELYGQNIPSNLQNAYRHMDIEHRLLCLGTDKFRVDVIESKRNGLKTEPTFASLLQLEGNPYQALLDLEAISDVKLGDLLKKQSYLG